MKIFRTLYKSLTIVLLITLISASIPPQVWAMLGQDAFGIRPAKAATNTLLSSVDPLSTISSFYPELNQHLPRLDLREV